MSNLTKKIHSKRKKSGKADVQTELPIYESGGYAPKKKRHVPYKLIITVGIIFALITAIYLPEMLYTPTQGENRLVLPAKLEAVKLTSEYTRDCPEEDFDGDGLINHLEQQYGSSPRTADTDHDGVSDYSEIYRTGTSPSVYDSGLLEKQVKAELDAEGKKFSDPYKRAGTILWADDMRSRAFGTVVRTPQGYSVRHFTGWIELPGDGYAYEISNGEYRLLRYKEDSNAWRIEGDTEILLSEEKLSFQHTLHFAAWEWSLSDNLFGKALSAILPDHAGLLTCRPVADYMNESTAVRVQEIQTPEYDKNDRTRYGSNHNSLKELGEVYALIDGGSCVLASLNSTGVGETLILIYGYSSDGNLLIADPESTQPVGILTVKPNASVVMTAAGKIEQQEFFDFIGLGFDSALFDRIHFISATAVG